MHAGFSIRTIRPSDDRSLAKIIRTSLEDFDAVKPGTVYFDPTTDHLSEVFTLPGSNYFVLEIDEQVVGGAGYYPTQNLPESTCELVKLYISAAARGKGMGKLLMQQCEEAAFAAGYKYIYLETMPELKIAVPMYEKRGYQYLQHAMGNSGHDGCDIWMLKELGQIEK
ncbi:MAG: GNAT family N-acetyltransferase [Gloeobacteraceae cyanobacterium ES-bin-316]|nr:GNAT family N-acetyltransferase [Ferruginibacter sp.]